MSSNQSYNESHKTQLPTQMNPFVFPSAENEYQPLEAPSHVHNSHIQQHTHHIVRPSHFDPQTHASARVQASNQEWSNNDSRIRTNPAPTPFSSDLSTQWGSSVPSIWQTRSAPNPGPVTATAMGHAASHSIHFPPSGALPDISYNHAYQGYQPPLPPCPPSNRLADVIDLASPPPRSSERWALSDVIDLTGPDNIFETKQKAMKRQKLAEKKKKKKTRRQRNRKKEKNKIHAMKTRYGASCENGGNNEKFSGGAGGTSERTNDEDSRSKNAKNKNIIINGQDDCQDSGVREKTESNSERMKKDHYHGLFADDSEMDISDSDDDGNDCREKSKDDSIIDLCLPPTKEAQPPQPDKEVNSDGCLRTEAATQEQEPNRVQTRKRSESEILTMQRSLREIALKRTRVDLQRSRAKLEKTKLMKEEELQKRKKRKGESLCEADVKKRREEALKAVKARLAAAQKRKEEAVLKVNLLKKKVSSTDTGIICKGEDASRGTSLRPPHPVITQGGKKCPPSSSFHDSAAGQEESFRLDDITAFNRETLIIANIGESGPSEKVRHRSIGALPLRITSSIASNDAISVQSQSAAESNEDPTQNGMDEPCDSQVPTEAPHRPPVSTAEKLKLDLELAKRKLRLEQLRRKKTKKIHEAKGLTVGADLRSAEEPEHGTKSKGVTDVDMNVEVKTEDKKDTVHALMEKKENLRESINASKEANRERKHEQEVSNLRTLITKQKGLLDFHRGEVKSCVASLQHCQDGIAEERLAMKKSEAELSSLIQRKAATREMVKSVTKKILDLRRQR